MAYEGKLTVVGGVVHTRHRFRRDRWPYPETAESVRMSAETFTVRMSLALRKPRRHMDELILHLVRDAAPWSLPETLPAYKSSGRGRFKYTSERTTLPFTTAGQVLLRDGEHLNELVDLVQTYARLDDFTLCDGGGGCRAQILGELAHTVRSSICRYAELDLYPEKYIKPEPRLCAKCAAEDDYTTKIHHRDQYRYDVIALARRLRMSRKKLMEEEGINYA